MHLVDLLSQLVDSLLVFLAVRRYLDVVLNLRLIQFPLQLRYFRLSPLRYLRLHATHSASCIYTRVSLSTIQYTMLLALCFAACTVLAKLIEIDTKTSRTEVGEADSLILYPSNPVAEPPSYGFYRYML